MPEIDQVLSDTAGQQVQVIFTPHLMPMDRGILTTSYVQPARELSTAAALSILREFYHNEPFVRVSETLPTTKHVSHTNFCDLTARAVRGRLIVISAIDNLIKGASGAALQNFNLMHGFPESAALL
jgi:N-acetyl-gamma-glutamyl-phosphate reductase